MGKYTKYSHPRAHLTFEDRKRLGRTWNNWMKTKPGSISISAFAKAHGISRTLWRRELRRCTTGDIHTLNIRRRMRHEHKLEYIEYDAHEAQRQAQSLMRNKGFQIRTSSFMAKEISKLILSDKLSPYSTSLKLKDEYKDKYVPSPRTIYNLINAGLLEVKHGDTPYHPGKKKKLRIKPHPAKTVPGRNQITERPQEAENRERMGHLEKDTVVSSIKGRGGTLCLYDRMTRRYCIEKIKAITQKRFYVP